MNKLIWCLLFPALLFTAMYAWGHDPSGKNAYTDWFLAQEQEPNPTMPYLAKCCGDIDTEGGDAHYVDVMAVAGQWLVKVGEDWVVYPLPVNPWHRNPTGQNVAWYKVFSEGGSSTITWYCLRLAAGT